MIELDERLQRLAADVVLPETSPEDDLARGRARLHRRNLGAAGAALTMAVVIGGSITVLSTGDDGPGADPGVASGGTKAATTPGTTPSPSARPHRAQEIRAALDGYRDILRDDLDPAGTRLQTSPITNRQTGDNSLGTKLDWNHGGLLQIAVGRSLEGVQFFCDDVCTRHSVPGATEALALTSPGRISVAVFQDDGDIVALTADSEFGNNGTSTDTLGLTLEQLLAAAADPRLDLPDPAVLADPKDQSMGAIVGTQ